MNEVRKFPIMVGGHSQGTKGPCPSWIPWDAIAPYEGHAKANHDQTLEGLASRGGLDPVEALFVMTGRRWDLLTPITDEIEREACAFLDKIVRDRVELQAAHDRYKIALEEIERGGSSADPIKIAWNALNPNT